MNLLWKFLAVITITIGGVALSCGGNIILQSITRLGEFGYILWGIEGIIIFVWSVRKFFFRTTTWESQSKLMKIMIFAIPILGGIFTLIFLSLLQGI